MEDVWAEILKAIPVFLFSMLKFILGPMTGFASRLHFVTTVICTVGGMMTSVTLFTYFGEWLRNRFFKKRKWFIFDSKRMAGFWSKYGLTGIALLTPIILTPIGGALLAVSLGNPKEKIIFFMFVSGSVWALIFTGIVYTLGTAALPDFLP